LCPRLAFPRGNDDRGASGVGKGRKKTLFLLPLCRDGGGGGGGSSPQPPSGSAIDGDSISSSPFAGNIWARKVYSKEKSILPTDLTNDTRDREKREENYDRRSIVENRKGES